MERQHLFPNRLAITNAGTAATTASMRYYPRGGGAVVERSITMQRSDSYSKRRCRIAFGFANDSVGFSASHPRQTRARCKRAEPTRPGVRARVVRNRRPDLAVAGLLQAGEVSADSVTAMTLQRRRLAARPGHVPHEFALVNDRTRERRSASRCVLVAQRKSYGRRTAWKDYTLAPWELKLLPLQRDPRRQRSTAAI